MWSARSALPMCAVACALAGPALADPLPTPTVDFALKAKLRDGGSLDLAHSNGKMRMEILPKASPAMVVGLIDMKTGKIVVMVPSMPKMAVQTDLPPEYNFASLAGSGSGTKVGTAQVAGEPCDLWKVETSSPTASTGPTTACITADGIALRTEVEIQGKPQVIYEATALTRAPQDAHLFVMPTGVQTIKIPKGASAAALPSLLPGAAVR